MTIASLDDWISAAKYYPLLWKNVNVGANATAPTSVFNSGGIPTAGTLGIGNTANGLVHTDTTAGYPPMPTLSGTGYLSRVVFHNIITCNMALYDRVFACGAYSFNSEVTLSAQPSYSSRIPGANYGGLELWFEAVTAFTGTPTIEVEYLDQNGNTGNTGALSLGFVPPVNRMFRFPLAAGDYGIQQINHVHATIATVGTFNINVLRPLWFGRISTAYEVQTDDLIRTGMPQVYGDSAIYLIVSPDAAATQTPYFQLEIADK